MPTLVCCVPHDSDASPPAHQSFQASRRGAVLASDGGGDDDDSFLCGVDNGWFAA